MDVGCRIKLRSAFMKQHSSLLEKPTQKINRQMETQLMTLFGLWGGAQGWIKEVVVKNVPVTVAALLMDITADIPGSKVLRSLHGPKKEYVLGRIDTLVKEQWAKEKER